MLGPKLGLMPPDASDSPAKNGLVTFCAFVMFGVIPLLSWVLAVGTDGWCSLRHQAHFEPSYLQYNAIL